MECHFEQFFSGKPSVTPYLLLQQQQQPTASRLASSVRTPAPPPKTPVSAAPPGARTFSSLLKSNSSNSGNVFSPRPQPQHTPDPPTAMAELPRSAEPSRHTPKTRPRTGLCRPKRSLAAPATPTTPIRRSEPSGSLPPPLAKRTRTTPATHSSPQLRSPKTRSYQSWLSSTPTSKAREPISGAETQMDQSPQSSQDLSSLASSLAVEEEGVLDTSIADLVKTRRRKSVNSPQTPVSGLRPLGLRGTTP